MRADFRRLSHRGDGDATRLDGMNWKAIILSACFLILFLPSTSSASDYVARRAAAKQQCEAISPSESQSGLFFNPDGYRSYYVQSQCFQTTAEQYRDSSLCDRVRRRYSLFSSSWGISSTQCQKLVAKGIEADRTELEKEKQLYTSNPARLLKFRVERNGNGRDFDFIPEFSTGNPHGYRLVFEIVGAGRQPIVVHSDGCYVDSESGLRIFVRQADVRARFPEFLLNHPYSVRGSVTYSVGMGGPSGYWSDEFLESIFPLRERTQSLTIESKF
jgi:hypothetical protein